MSTKTSFKRIALVAVAALGMGVLTSVAPASATVPTLFKITTAESIGTDTDTATTVAGASNYVDVQSKVDATSGATVRVDLTGATFVDVTETVAGTDPDGAGATDSTTAPAATWSYNVAATVASSSSNDVYGAKTGSGTAGYQTLRINTPTAGTATAKVYEVTITSGVATSTLIDTLTITVNAAATAGTLSVANSTSILDAGGTSGGTHDATADEAVSVSKAAATAAGAVKLTLKDLNNVNMPDATTVTATVTGPGIVSMNTTITATYANGGRVDSSTISSGVAYALIYGDGTSGVSTITFTVGSVVVATEKVTFYGALASLKATVKKNVAASGTATDAALDVIGYDASGVVVPGVGITVTSGTTATIASFTETTSTAAEATAGTAVVSVTGVSGTYGAVALAIKDTATGLVTTTATVNVGAGEAATVTAAFDKASYAPGELVTLIITAKDANGAAVGDVASVASAYEITTSAPITGTATTAALFNLGVQKVTFYAPLLSGPLSASIKLVTSGAWATAIDGTTITAASKVAASSEISALTLLINSLIKKLNALSTLVAKIQKKLGVK